MIDISHKHSTLRYAKAEGVLITKPEVIKKIKENSVPKGDVLSVVRAAGIQAAKRTSEWVVFSHSIPLDWIEISFEIQENQIKITAEARTIWKVALDMEVMTAVSAALLNMTDMLKSLDKNIEFGMIRIVERKGGVSDYQDQFSKKLKAALLFASDAVENEKKEDRTTTIVRQFLEERGIEILSTETIPEDKLTIEQKLVKLTEHEDLHFIFAMGSTGLRDRDILPEVTRKVIQTEIPGLAEGMREHGRQRTPYAMFSREVCGIRNQTVIINLPGSSRGAEESLNALFPGLEHILLSAGIVSMK